MAGSNDTSVYCIEVTPQCTVKHSIYGYYPSIGANAFFVAVFAMCGALQLLFGIRYKTWTYLIAMSKSTLPRKPAPWSEESLILFCLRPINNSTS